MELNNHPFVELKILIQIQPGAIGRDLLPVIVPIPQGPPSRFIKYNSTLNLRNQRILYIYSSPSAPPYSNSMILPIIGMKVPK